MLPMELTLPKKDTIQESLFPCIRTIQSVSEGEGEIPNRNKGNAPNPLDMDQENVATHIQMSVGYNDLWRLCFWSHVQKRYGWGWGQTQKGPSLQQHPGYRIS